MVETAQARAGNHCCFRSELVLNRPAIRCVLVETVVNAVLLGRSSVWASDPLPLGSRERRR